MSSASNSSVLPLDQILPGDCSTVLKTLPDASVDFIFTSPPYADNRKKTYQGIPIKDYVDWFLPLSKELLRVLNRHIPLLIPGTCSRVN